jgi:hypothetical protein
MTSMEAFGKYVGIQGVLAFFMMCGYIAAALLKIDLPKEYPSFMTFVFGFYFAKNGVGIIAALRGKSSDIAPKVEQTREE